LALQHRPGKVAALMNNLRRALKFFRPDTGRIMFAVILLVLSTGVGLMKPWPLAFIVDSIIGDKPLPSWLNWTAGWGQSVLLALFGGSILLLHAGQGALQAWQNLSSIKVGLRGLGRVRNRVFHWIERLSLRFHLGRSQGDLIYRASWDTYAFQTLFQQGIFTFLGSSFSLLLMLVVMWQLNVRLALWAMLIVPLLAVAMKFFGREMKDRSLAAHQADSQVTSSIQQTITSLPLIQSYTREEYEEERFAELVQTAFQKRIAQHGWEVVYWLVIAIGFGLAVAGLTWLGAREVLAGRLTIGELLVFLGYLAQLYDPLNQLSHVGATLSDASAGTQRVFELLDTPCEVAEKEGARPVARARSDTQDPETLIARGNLAFEQISFAYSEDRLVLQEISFTVNGGESVALVGPSGAGKTTLLQLVPRFYDPSTGAVRLEGIDIRDLRVRDLRAQVALVPQEPILMMATIAENIAYGRPGATMAEIESAARAAHADEFISRLPQGYRTVVGESAARLSAGEKQRVNLARAFLKDAPILVLDEPTSALDAESEEYVVESLARLMRNRTTILVAHRFSTFRSVDKVLVIEAGKLVQYGPPEQLLKQSGYFARIAGAQLQSR
jgi:ATP-binding cassette, subfamily B, bacterial